MQEHDYSFTYFFAVYDRLVERGEPLQTITWQRFRLGLFVIPYQV